MKHILLVTVISLLFIACGKNNTTSSGTTISSNPSTTVSTSAQTTTDFAAFKTAVNNGNFQYPTYSYVNVYLRSFTTEVDKHKFLGIPYNTYDVSSSNMTPRIDNRSTNVFQHELGANSAALKAALAALVNNASGSPVKCGTACFSFVSGSKWYSIDLNSPMIANPVSSNDGSNTGYQMLLWQGSY